MGASFSVPCRSRKAAEGLAAFLRANLRPLTVAARAPENADLSVIGLESIVYDPTAHVCLGRELAYGAGSTKVGFNISWVGIFRPYIEAILAWSALRVGRKRGLNALGIVGHAWQQVPYYTYESQPIPVLLPSHMIDWDPLSQRYARDHWEVDHLGFRIANNVVRTHMAQVEATWAKTEAEKAVLARQKAQEDAMRALVEREMRRLDQLWDAST